MLCQTEDSDLGHGRVYFLQSLKQNQWLNSKVMDVIFDVAATRRYTLSFPHIVMKNLFWKVNFERYHSTLTES